MSRYQPAARRPRARRAALAVVRARALLRELAPDAVMGGGGYVAGPVGLAAVTLRIPLVLSEADSHLGLTNRLLAPFARRVCLAFPIARPGGGRASLSRDRPAEPTAAGGPRGRTGAPRSRRGEACVLVFGGSLGARSINQAAVGGVCGQRPCACCTCTGRRDYPSCCARAAGWV